ncbi:MAG: hypothetical protein AABX08_02265 [Nanoarchaeota archaeon]
MKIIAKSFPNREQIQGRIDSGAFDGIEIFTFEDILENPGKYRDLAKFARDHFDPVNFETFYAVTVDGEKKAEGLIDERPEVRKRSRQLLEKTIELNEGKGNVNTHLVGKHAIINPKILNRPTVSPLEQLTETGEYLRQFASDITLENVYTVDPYTVGKTGGNVPSMYNIGCDMPDFKFMYENFGVPITLDTAHLAISLAEYARYIKNGHIKVNGDKVTAEFLKHQHELGERVIRDGLTNVLIEQIGLLPQIKNLHFINAKLDENDDPSDGYAELTAEDGRLIDLEKVLSYLKSRQDVTQILPEVVDGLYPNPDYVKVPHMVRMAQELRNLVGYNRACFI